MKIRSAVIFLFAAAVLFYGVAPLLSAPLQAKKAGVRFSPKYTVMVSLQATSPYVPDGRMSFADLAFSATFKDVVFIYDPAHGAGFVENHDGKLLLTRREFNDVYDGESRHRPWIEKPWPAEFSASLLASSNEEDADEGDEDIPPLPLIPDKIGIGFYARFGLLDLEWCSNLGSNVLSDMLFEFQVPLEQLMEGRPLSLNLPYQGAYAEDKGTWWIEFIPAKSK
ncbi:MAG: hypothetical protein GXY53_05235 [Desulfobulbus sp.]|nr:hypothetical protein [Desulfobulbus sp.]